MPYHVPDVPEIFCDDCGPDIPGALYVPEEPVDCPQHCASEGACAEPIYLRDYGLLPGDALYGAERRSVSALVYDRLTREGVHYLKDMLRGRDTQRTPYQRALHAYWREAFADYLEDLGLCPVCGEWITLTGETTKDYRLIGSCGDAFTEDAWEG